MSELVRLQKILARAGCGSRRSCETFIEEGRVTVDGVVIKQLGSKADPETQNIELDGQKIAGPGKKSKTAKAASDLVYYMLNKPKGVLSTNEDPSGRPLAVQLVPEKRRIFCVGRLDKDTEGLLLLTNDGELTNQLTHPRYGVEKVYMAKVDGRVTLEQVKKLEKGVHLAEGRTQGAAIRVRKKGESSSVLELTISEGMNRQVRRMLAAVDLYCRTLKRVGVGPLRLGDLPTGAARRLTTDELERLKAALRRAKAEMQDKGRGAVAAFPSMAQQDREEVFSEAREGSRSRPWEDRPSKKIQFEDEDEEDFNEEEELASEDLEEADVGEEVEADGEDLEAEAVEASKEELGAAEVTAADAESDEAEEEDEEEEFVEPKEDEFKPTETRDRGAPVEKDVKFEEALPPSEKKSRWQDRGESSEYKQKRPAGEGRARAKPYEKREPRDRGERGGSWQRREGGGRSEGRGGKPWERRGRSEYGRGGEGRPQRGDREGGAKPWQRREGAERSERGGARDGKPWERGDREGGRKPWQNRGEGGAKPWQNRGEGGAKPWQKREEGARKPWQNRGEGGAKPWQKREGAGRGEGRGGKPWERREGGAKPYERREGGAKPYERREGAVKPWERREGGERPARGERFDRGGAGGGRKPWQNRGEGGAKPWQRREGAGGAEGRGGKPWERRERSDRGGRGGEGRPQREFSNRPWENRERPRRGGDGEGGRERGQSSRPWEKRGPSKIRETDDE